MVRIGRACVTTSEYLLYVCQIVSIKDYIEPREWNKIKYSMINGGTGKECNKVNDLLHNKCLTTDLTLCTSSVAEFADTNHNWQG